MSCYLVIKPGHRGKPAVTSRHGNNRDPEEKTSTERGEFDKVEIIVIM